jgi:hypothetical protein
MRFLEDGPDLPDTLLEARDLGEVVFFCGAGISLPAGLPDFGRLADKLLDELTAEASRRVREEGQSLDYVFKEMVKEFGSAAVDRALAKALRTPRNADLRYHRAAIDLSRGRDGVPKIVTTNFDLLFERVDRRLRSYVPPSLPDLSQLQPIDGIVYLHGRLKRAAGIRSGYVITSADFGRAYLAEGWAARFVRGLSERYTVVLLGYSANDPPMRYLLEGLNSRDDPGRRSLIYAFAPEGSAADESWRDKGVTVIAYEARDRAHSGLWDSLFAWADAARDPEGWRAQQVALAQRQPADLKPFERGQVANLVSTAEGAQVFASADPAPPAEWLCVLDANSRYAKPGKRRWDDETEVDPLDVFGLDGDPPRPEPRGDGSFVAPGDDLLGWRRGDEHWPERQRLMGFDQRWTNQLPKRLYWLASWFGRVMEQPAAIWWAAGRVLPHPGMTREIDYRLERGADLPPSIRHFWECYLAAVNAQSREMQDLRQYDVLERVRKEGWTNGVVRDLEAALAPTFSISRALISPPVPPKGAFDDLGLLSLVEIRVTVSRWADGLDPPPERLARVVAMVRRSLERMSEMIGESTAIYWRTPTLHPTGDRGENFQSDREESHFLKFRDLFAALVAHDALAARREMDHWDINDPVFFAKLYLFAVTLPGLVGAADFARHVLAMPDETWWNEDLTREMLFALRVQWTEMQGRDRAAIEQRIINGRPLREGYDEADHERMCAARAASWLRWLELNGRTLSRPTRRRLIALKVADPRWSDAWAWVADDSGGPRGGYVECVTASQGLEGAAVPNIVALATELSTDDHRQLRDYRPFVGLVKEHPLRALSALRLVARRGEHPMRFWHNVVDEWPEETADRIVLLLAHTLARLPNEAFAELRFGIARWVSKALGPVMRRRRGPWRGAFDKIASRYLSAAPETLSSAIGTVRSGGVERERSEFSLMKSINAPGGNLVRTVLDQLGDRKRPGRMPSWIDSRLERLLMLPGDGAGHAACVITRQYHWMNYWFPEWTAGLTPFFAPDHPLSEAMWHGLASGGDFIGNAAGRRIGPDLAAVLTGGAPWELDTEARRGLAALMVNLSVPRGKEPAVYSMTEVRRILVAGGEETRTEALGVLSRTRPDDDLWARLFRPFLTEAWPQQLKYQNDATSRQLAFIVEKAGSHFPEAVALVVDHLRPVAHLDTFAYRIRKQDEEGEGYALDYPAETLRVLNALVGDDPKTAPWNLREVLEIIATAMPALRQSDPWRRLKAIAQ